MVESSSEEKVKLISKEGTEIFVEKKIIIRSVYAKGQLDDQAEFVLCPEVKELTLNRIIKYLYHLEEGNAPPEIEKPLRSNDMKDVTTDWFANFVDLNDEEVQDMILAANFMDIKCLLVLACAKMGSIIRSLSIPEFRKRFDIVNDFTPEEEAEPFDEAKLAELAEAYEKEQAAKKEESKVVEEEKKGE
jgi:S-phase kinase-associated protein 1